jgi:hypothetical protein
MSKYKKTGINKNNIKYIIMITDDEEIRQTIVNQSVNIYDLPLLKT